LSTSVTGTVEAVWSPVLSPDKSLPIIPNLLLIVSVVSSPVFVPDVSGNVIVST